MARSRSKKDTAQFDEMARGKRPSLIVEFLYFLRYNKKWWLLPIVVVLLLLCLLVLLGGSGAAVFIYPLF